MVEKISPRAGLELGTTRSVGQRLTHCATGASRGKETLGMLELKIFKTNLPSALNKRVTFYNREN